MGDDQYILHNAFEVVVEAAGEGRDLIMAGFSIDLRKAAYANVEDVALTGLTALRIDGSAADNMLYGNAIGNTILGYDGNDMISGMGGNDKLDGGNGNDWLSGGTGRDTLIGGAGDDTLSGDAGTDSLVGGAGNDTYQLDSASDVIVEAAGGGTDTVEVGYAGNVSLSKWANVENLKLMAAGASRITGSAAANVLQGNDDGDVIDGLDGDDTLLGGAGNDSLLGGAGHDVIRISGGIDTLVGGAGNDRYEVLGSGLGHTVISDTEGDDDQMVLSVSLQDLAFSRSGDDLLIKYVPQGVPAQHLPDDQALIQAFFVAGANSIERFVTQGRVIDRAAVLAMMEQGHVITGTAGNDDLTAPANDGPDTLIGGQGDDVYRIASARDVVVEQPGEGLDTIYFTMGAGDGYDLSKPEALGVENLIAVAGSVGGGRLAGNALDNLIQGSQTVGTVYSGGKGNDSLRGGTGNDWYEFALGDGQDVIDDAGGTGDVLAMQVEATRLGAQRIGQDLIIKVLDTQDQVTVKGWFDGPNNGPDLVYTLSPVGYSLDRAAIEKMLQPGVLVNGTSGNDTLTASGTGQGDTLVGGLGDDQYQVKSSQDVVRELPGEGVDTVWFGNPNGGAYSLNTPDAANVENLRFATGGGLGNVSMHLTGNALDNQIGVLNASIFTNDMVLMGLDGNDTLYATKYGGDTLIGGAGNDTYVIAYSASHVIVEDADGGIDTIDASQGYAGQGQGAVSLTDAQCAHIENMIWRTGAGASVLQGNDLDNVLTILADNGIMDGGKGNDTLVGNSGTNNLTGGLGDDVLQGLTGDDYYIYQAGDGRDTIVDTAGSADKLVLNGIATSDLSWAKSESGQDLLIGFASHASDQITVRNWFSDPAAQIETIATSTGSVSSQDVNALLQAMAAGAAPVGLPSGGVMAPAAMTAGSLLA